MVSFGHVNKFNQYVCICRTYIRDEIIEICFFLDHAHSTMKISALAYFMKPASNYRNCFARTFSWLTNSYTY